MRFVLWVPVLAAALGLATGTPTVTDPGQPSKRALAPAVTVSGNGTFLESGMLVKATDVAIEQRFGKATLDSISGAWTISQGGPR